MEAPILSPQSVEDNLSQTVTFIPADKIDETFKSDSIGRSSNDHATYRSLISLLTDHTRPDQQASRLSHPLLLR